VLEVKKKRGGGGGGGGGGGAMHGQIVFTNFLIKFTV